MNGSNSIYDVLVVGGGLAGLTAAQLAAQRGLSVASLDDGGHMGGLVLNIGRIDGIQGGGDVSGIDLAAARLEALLEHGCDVIPEAATGFELAGGVKIVTTESGRHRAKSVVVASGARLKMLGVPGEGALLGRGVSQCADCDAGFFAGRNVVVVGGGDAALQEALHLTDYVSGITLVTCGGALRARADYIARADADPKFSFRLSTTVTEILGVDGVEAVRLASADGAVEDLSCAGVFVFVGLVPNSAFLPNDIETDDEGYIVTDSNFRTNLAGVYAIGAVRAGYSGQLTNALDEAAAVAAGISTP